MLFVSFHPSVMVWPSAIRLATFSGLNLCSFLFNFSERGRNVKRGDTCQQRKGEFLLEIGRASCRERV